MTAHVFITCPTHPAILPCGDDASYEVESATTALALHEARFPAATGKSAYIAIDCELGGCLNRVVVKADSIAEGRAKVATHTGGWYRSRRSGGRLADACQWHLGCCCIVHASGDSPTLDRGAVLPEHAPEAPIGQLDLFSEVA